jgi:hypothetical protein
MQSGIGIPGNAGPPTGCEPETQIGEYTWEWAELRRLHRKVLLVGAAGIAIFGLLVPVTAVADSDWVVLPLFLGWTVVAFTLFSTLIKISSWACPRCGKPFYSVHETFGRMVNPVARRCMHCRLPKWIESDPDPKLKRELDPFRTDQIFKLGDTTHNASDDLAERPRFSAQKPTTRTTP